MIRIITENYQRAAIISCITNEFSGEYYKKPSHTKRTYLVVKNNIKIFFFKNAHSKWEKWQKKVLFKCAAWLQETFNDTELHIKTAWAYSFGASLIICRAIMFPGCQCLIRWVNRAKLFEPGVSPRWWRHVAYLKQDPV